MWKKAILWRVCSFDNIERVWGMSLPGYHTDSLHTVFQSTEDVVDFIKNILSDKPISDKAMRAVTSGIRQEIKDRNIKDKLLQKFNRLKSKEHLVPFPITSKNFNFVIAGGYIGDLLRGEEEYSKDIDIFFQTPNHNTKFEGFLQSSEIFSKLMDNNNFFRFEVHEIKKDQAYLENIFFEMTESGRYRDYFYMDNRDPMFVEYIENDNVYFSTIAWAGPAQALRDRAGSIADVLSKRGRNKIDEDLVKKVTTNSASFLLDDDNDHTAYNIVWKPECVKTKGENLLDVVNDFDFLHTTLAYRPETGEITGLNLASFLAARYKILIPNAAATRLPYPERTAKFIRRGYNTALLSPAMINDANAVLSVWGSHDSTPSTITTFDS